MNRKILYRVVFHNELNDVYISIAMEYNKGDFLLDDYGEKLLNTDQRIEAYDELSKYVSEDFIRDTVIDELIEAITK
jgi:hypothetical protein